MLMDVWLDKQLHGGTAGGQWDNRWRGGQTDGLGGVFGGALVGLRAPPWYLQ